MEFWIVRHKKQPNLMTNRQKLRIKMLKDLSNMGWIDCNASVTPSSIQNYIYINPREFYTDFRKCVQYEVRRYGSAKRRINMQLNSGYKPWVSDLRVVKEYDDDGFELYKEEAQKELWVRCNEIFEVVRYSINPFSEVLQIKEFVSFFHAAPKKISYIKGG